MTPTGDAGDSEAGFGLIELVVAITIVAGTFLAFAHAAAGGLFALSSARSRTVFIELANAEMETLRALPFASLGVAATDPDLATAYPGGSYDGQPAVLLDVPALQAGDPSFRPPPPAVSVVTTSPVTGVTTPYTIRRWVTWSSDAGATGAADLKRITVELVWSDSNRGTRHAVLHSLRYPGGLGPRSGATPPVANVTASPTTVDAGVPVQFDGSASTDADGTIVAWDWQFGDGTTANTAVADHPYGAAGTYTAVLTVTDDDGEAASATVTVTVTAGADLPPVAAFTASAVSGVAPFTVNVDASTSFDPESGPLSYAWDWGDGTAPGAGVSATHTYDTPGTFTAVLTVTDLAGLQGAATLAITAVPLNCAITEAYFHNGSNPERNDIDVKGNSGQLEASGFVFTATTNLGCTDVAVSIPNISGNLSLVGTSGDTKTWSWSTTSSEQFPVALGQSGTFTGTGLASFPITLDVHK